MENLDFLNLENIRGKGLSLSLLSLSLSRSCSLVELLVEVVAPNSSGEKIHLTSAQEEHEYDIHKQ